MFRYVVVIILSSCFPLPVISQAVRVREAEIAVGPPAQGSPSSRSAWSHGATDAHISIRRLRVPRKAWRLYEKALAEWSRHAFSNAQGKLDQALKIDAEFPDALAFRGAILASYGQWDSAEQSVQTAIHSDPSFYPAYVVLAGVYNSQARYKEAEEATSHALAAGGDTWSIRYEIARALIGKGQYQEALVVTDLALRSEHGGLMHLARAHALMGLQRYPEAAVDLRTYLKDDPGGEGSQDARGLLAQLQTLTSR